MAFSLKFWTPLLVLIFSSHNQSFSQTQDPVLVDRVAAIVGTDTITTSEIETFVAFRGFRLPESTQAKQNFYGEILDQLINQDLIIRETEKTPFIVVKENELDSFLASYKKRFESGNALKAFLDSLELSEKSLRSLIYRQLSVNKFIELRFEPFMVILPADIEEYYEGEYAEELEKAGQLLPPLDLVEESIREILKTQKTTEQLERWIASARERIRIQILLFRDPPDSSNLP
jgi:hypothetical protein